MTQQFLKGNHVIESVLNAIPLPIFLVDEDVRIFWCNQSATPLFVGEPDLVFLRRCGEVFHCVHAMESPGGCGHTPICPECPIRNSVKQSIQGQRVVREKNKLRMAGKGRVVELNLLVTTSPFPYPDESLVLLILEDISEFCLLYTSDAA